MKSLAEKGPARSDATAQLLLLLARDTLSPELTATALNLMDQIQDWEELVILATHNASLPFVYKHLFALKPKSLPEAILSDMRLMTMAQTFSALKLTAGMTAFHRDCIAPVGACHAYMKGPALAHRFYRDPAMRSCVDVDILVAERDYAKVARLAHAQGYRFVLDPDAGTFIEHEQDLSFAIRHSDVISLFSKDNVHIELHRYIEKSTPIFPVARILNETHSMQVGDQTVQTLSTAWHFVYITYHHSRHFWSRLHWVADVDALSTHPTFDRQEVLKIATDIGLKPTVEAAIEFARLTAVPSEWPSVLNQTPGGIFLDAALRGLPGDSAFELESWDAMFLFDFGDQWQFDADRKFSFWLQSALRRMQPTVYQYIANRRARPLEWLYYLENFAALFGNFKKRLSAQ
jgi:hypothetical protein